MNRRRRYRIAQGLRRMMPVNLFARTLLILLIPMILLQLMVAGVFYQRHWDTVVRNMSATTAADVHLLLQEYRRLSIDVPPEQALLQTAQMGQMLSMRMSFAAPGSVVTDGKGAKEFPDFYRSLDRLIEDAFMLSAANSDRSIRVRVAMDHRVVDVTFSRKRLASATTSIFIVWMMGSSFLLVLIAALFLRNQIRPIVQLSRAAEQFGLGQDVHGFSPRGASEIRRAGRAFLIMAERIRRQVASRTEMLAGISHDLRTPLTRMQLEIEMGKIDASTRTQLVADINEMRGMIDEYLAFARGDVAEPMELLSVEALVQSLVALYHTQGADVCVTESVAVAVMMRPQAMRRALMNLIDNALRYGKSARVSVEQSIGFVRIKVSDQGAGIPEAEHETVFKPFTRLEPSRNSATGGVGLGLSIARDIAQSHGGDVTLENLRDEAGAVTGLEATIRLPREMQVQSA